MTSAAAADVEPCSRKLKLAHDPSEVSLAKHLRRASISGPATISDKFSQDLFLPANRDSVKDAIAASGPYCHGCIPALLNDSLLRNVRKEIMESLHFTQKETDIYKIFQTGDLRNLSGLAAAELAKLENLFELRQALYSPEFREYVSYVTGCGSLSGVKQDLSINVYQHGCHLLTHDDVIGSRRISFILYMPDPDEAWEYPRNGGALRLYPTIKPNVPAQDWTLVVPPAWNQFAFFTVLPGLSFHDVEEVFVDKERMSVQGWFHIPQAGEPGYIEGEQEDTEAKSTLQMLESDEIQEYDFPKRNYSPVTVDNSKKDLAKAKLEDDIEGSPLDEQDFEYLSQFMNPTLLKAPSIKMLSQYFCDESALEIRDFLNADYARLVKRLIDSVDADLPAVPKTSKDVEDLPFWKLAGPPHKMRYMYMDGRETYADETAVKSGSNSSTDALFQNMMHTRHGTADEKLAQLATMFQSPQFLSWLVLVSSLDPIAQRVLVRRFRPALDYTLATTNTGQSQETSTLILEATLCMTPTKGWANGELGGYELAMLAEDDVAAGFDPAVYRGSSSSTATTPMSPSTSIQKTPKENASKATDDDAVLLTTQADWNVLSLMVRDEGILKFVKYVSGNAPGSRWDISCEWTVENEDGDE